MWFTLLSGSLRLRDWLAESSSNSFVSIPSESSYSKNKKKKKGGVIDRFRFTNDSASSTAFGRTIKVPLTSLLLEFAESASASGVQLRSAPRFVSLFSFIRFIGWHSLNKKKTQERIKTRFDTMMKWWSDIELVEWNDAQQLILPGRHAAEVVEQLGSSLLVLQLLLVFLQRQRDPLHSVHLHGAAERRRRRRYPRRGRRRAAAVAIAVAATAAGAAARCRSASSGRTGGMRPARRVNARNWNVRWICLHPHYNSK